jgi:hypothetical protein
VLQSGAEDRVEGACSYMGSRYIVEHLNHLGIVAEVCREIGVAAWLDQQDPGSRQPVSASVMCRHCSPWPTSPCCAPTRPAPKEVRCLLWWLADAAGALRWSSWRRRQGTTWRCHYRRRLGLRPP